MIFSFGLRQIFDTGCIEGPFGSFTVTNVQVYAGYVLHIGSFSQASKPLSVGDKVTCKVLIWKKCWILFVDL
jgi:alanyl-tRNA synthetase